ncbi:enkurin-like isoform X1 [Argiope bruennichi]|uniref:Enkurin like protein n=2 Tax=Argiope bruennichi TaxID=94029 RepID=A0A8T0FW57_ARGBR|nr:enkurin-like isoform X1 [Argiope bruennichi]KAF8795344.1 Enkurin like protein [Argiope bruennichi]
MTEYQKIVIGKKFKDIQIPSENIYNLILRSPEIQNKTPRYQSKYSNKTKKFYGSKKKPHQTMGYAKTPLKSPAEYLKKHTRETKPNKESKPFSCLDISHKRPPVPKKEDAPLIIHEGKDKNFISLNKLDVIRKPALRPARKSVDTQKGDSFFLEFSGLVPKFCMKKEFGVTPKYLVQRRKDLQYSNELYQKSHPNRKFIKLSEEERNNLLEGLRANWERLNTQYMSLPLVIDTKSLKSRKLELERKLDLLEHDIYFLEKNEENDIYVLPE